MKAESRSVNTIGEPDAGNPPVRFDGGALESWRSHAPALYPTKYPKLRFPVPSAWDLFPRLVGVHSARDLVP